MVQHKGTGVAAILAVSLAAVIGTAKVSRAADDCLAKPNVTAPQGSHWYYRIDRTTHRQCWFLGAEGGKGQAYAVRQDSVPVRPRPSKMTAHAKPQAPAQTITADAANEGPLPAKAVPVKPQARAQTITADATGEGPLPAKAAPVKPQAPAQTITADATGEGPAKAVPVEILVGQAKPSEDNSIAGVTSWAAIPPPTLSIDTGSAAMRNSSAESTKGPQAEEQSTKEPQAEEQGTKDSEEEMPLIWPILSDEEFSTVARPPDSPISFALCAALAAFFSPAGAELSPIPSTGSAAGRVTLRRFASPCWGTHSLRALRNTRNAPTATPMAVTAYCKDLG